MRLCYLSLLACVLVLCPLHSTPAASASETVAIRPPATPLVACDPYFSIWSTGDELTSKNTTHWTGKPNRLASFARIDGEVYRLMGAEPQDVPPLEQTGRTVSPTQTVYQFAGAGVELELKFTTPLLPEDIDLLSRPITYLTYKVRATDGAEHQVQLYFDASAELAVNVPSQKADGATEDAGDVRAVRIGSTKQNILGHTGDDIRIEWGYLYLAAAKGQSPTRGLASPTKLRSEFFVSGQLPPTSAEPTKPTAANRLAGAICFDVPKLTAEPQARWLVLAYHDLYSIEFMHNQLRPYWRRNGLEAAGLLQEAVRDYDSLMSRCDAFDQELTRDMQQAGGDHFAALTALAYRQCFAAGKFVADANGQPLQFCKENNSNGCIATSDVFYPMAPQFLLFGPSLSKSFLAPFMEYAASERWKFPFAPHDLGTYPKANGQVYGGGERSEENQMPVEECGNLLVLMAAVARVEGHTQFADRYWEQLEQWANYLKQEGFDPDNQLCTDDFAGHLAHNVNLSAKAICGLGAFAQLCEMRGDDALAAEYRSVAKDYALRWIEEADDGDHFRLTFDRPGTWSQKYNLVWDKLLGLNLFPDAVRQKEMDYYLKVQNQYGLPLDNRDTYTKLDWILWTATLTQDREEFEALVQPVCKFLSETPDRVPMTDWYKTDTARRVGFTARPVVGGVFLQALYDGKLWDKWASRDQTGAGDYAPMPQPPKVTSIVPAATTKAVVWRYTTQKPTGDWTQPDFDDSAWREGEAGFGTPGTPGQRLGTVWDSSDIWIRRKFDFAGEKSEYLKLWMHHDEAVEVYINGKLACEKLGYTADYQGAPLSEPAKQSLQSAGNTIAVHCHQTTGGQYIDVGIATIEPVEPKQHVERE